MNRLLMPILDHLLEKRGFDFSGYRVSMLERRISRRLSATQCKDFQSYLTYLRHSSEEFDMLLDVLTIRVSSFFRDPLTFEFLAERILPSIIDEKIRLKDNSLRIWSAGCAAGEEPYSVAILAHELLQKEKLAMNLHLFATDIDANVLKEAEKAVYKASSLENIRHIYLTRYFTQKGQTFQLLPEIRKLVSFSQYDMLDKKRGVPAASIFGNFDLVLCRNLLIYFNTNYQKTILAKLHHAIARNGVLILGQAEAPDLQYRHCFSRAVDFSPIYRKCQEKITNEA
ncbi:MAG: chemotaxis protein CheR [Candidatus Riflebacteria bacterium GWC2_50_8]|nr:MAG: chemotaxis protein CheR [Candidatus Riflebacteria bacterium GWC2_50_8]